MSDRANQLITDVLRRLHEAIVENDVTYDEYQTAKQWLIDGDKPEQLSAAASQGHQKHVLQPCGAVDVLPCGQQALPLAQRSAGLQQPVAHVLVADDYCYA